MSRCFRAFTLSCLLCLVTVNVSSPLALAGLASASLTGAIAVRVCKAGAVLGRKRSWGGG